MAEKRKYRIEVLLLHSKLQQIRGKLKYRKFMTPQDFIEANRLYFEKSSISIQNEYSYSPQHPDWMRASELIMPGLEPDDV